MSGALLGALPAAAATPTPEQAKLDTFLRGQAALANDNHLVAARALADLSRASPDDLDLRTGAIQATMEAGLMDEAIALAAAMPVARLPLEARLLLIAADTSKGRIAASRRLFPATLGPEAAGFMRPFVEAWAAEEKGSDGDALLAAVPKDSPLYASIPEQRAYLGLLGGKPERVKPLLGAAMRYAGRRSAEVALGLAAGFAREGDRAVATDLAGAFAGGEEAIPEPRDRALQVRDARGALAQLYLGFAQAVSDGEEGDPKLALSLARMALLADPARPASQLAVANALAGDKRYGEALAAIRGRAFPRPLDARAADLEVEWLTKLKRSDEAIATASAYAGRDTRAEASARLAAAYVESGRLDQAVAPLREAIARADRGKTQSRWIYRLTLGDVLSRLKRWDEARPLMVEAMALSPDNPLLLNYVGYGDVEAGRNLAEAEAMIRKAHQLDPEDPAITDSLGWALFKLGRTDEAAALLRTAAQKSGNDPEIQEHLGDVLWAQGRRFEARYSWQAALLVADAADRPRIEAKIESGPAKPVAAR